MKKLLAILAVVFFVTSCEGPMGPPGPAGQDGRDGEDGYLQQVSVPITIQSEHWVREPKVGPLLYYYYRMDMPELTKYVINNGFFYTYYSWNDGNILVQEGTGYTYYNETKDRKLYSVTVATDYNVEEMTFYVRVSDFHDERPETMKFRFVAIW